MSSIRLTEQSANLPAPGEDQGTKTVELFAKDDPSNPGTTVVASVDSAGNSGNFQGPKGDQGDTGAIGPVGPPGTISSQFVTDILNPIEIESLTLAGVGRELIAHETVGSSGPDIMTVYSYDADGPAKNAPYVMNTGDGGTSRWIARGGVFHQTPPNSSNGSRFITAAEIIKLGDIDNKFSDDEFEVFNEADNTKILGFDSSAITTATKRTLSIPDENGTIVTKENDQTFDKNITVQGQAHSETNTLTDQASIPTDVNQGNVHTVTLQGNRTLSNPTNLKDGGTYVWIIKQDAVGGRTLAYGSSFKFEGGITPILSTASNAVDILSTVSDGANLFAQLIKDFK